jgi:hypothetical protein
MIRPDYMNRLNKLIDNNLSTPFEWGTWDCCVFSADAVEAMTGEDKLDFVRGQYDSKLGAAKMLREKGEGTLYKTTVSVLGEPIHKSRVKRGDVVLRKNNIGICTGRRAAFVGEDGLIWFSMSEIDHCFSIR